VASTSQRSSLKYSQSTQSACKVIQRYNLQGLRQSTTHNIIRRSRTTTIKPPTSPPQGGVPPSSSLAFASSSFSPVVSCPPSAAALQPRVFGPQCGGWEWFAGGSHFSACGTVHGLTTPLLPLAWRLPPSSSDHGVGRATAAVSRARKARSGSGSFMMGALEGGLRGGLGLLGRSICWGEEEGESWFVYVLCQMTRARIHHLTGYA
jgi:hypothetical protein